MKAFYILIIITLTIDICSSYDDLENGVQKNLDLVVNYTYNFYISMNQFQAAKIYINFNKINPDSPFPISDIGINKYKGENREFVNSSEINFTKSNNPNILAIESDYFFDETPRDYISLTFRTNSSIGETTILIDIFGGYYEIKEGKYLDFNKFYSGVPYYLTFKAKSGKLLNLQLTFSKIEELGIDNFSLIEYKDINHTIILNSIDYVIEKKIT